MRRLIVVCILLLSFVYQSRAQEEEKIEKKEEKTVVSESPSIIVDTVKNTVILQDTVKKVEIRISGPRTLGKNYIKGLRGIDSLSLQRVTWASVLVPGYGQAYNRQYWKIPAMYVGAGALIYGGSRSSSKYHETGLQKYKTHRNLYYMGAGLMYLGSIIDAVTNYKTPEGKLIPAKASFYSAFLPGLGQAYNGDYWKVPVVYAGFAFLGYWYDLNQMQYKRYRDAYNAATDNNPSTVGEFEGRLSADGVKRYRDKFRRDRDYAVLYMSLFYVLNIIEANVSAHLSDFDVSDDLSFNLRPTIMPETMFLGKSSPGIGLKLSFTLSEKKKKVKWLQ